jgi:hypothetical protein
MTRRAKPLLALAGLLVLAASAAAQFAYVPYYGKNKVNYERFAWKSYSTEHFKIFFYVDDPRLLKSVVDMAEGAYLKVSADLKHQLAEPVPLLYYTTVTDFEQSNVFPVSEGILGVAEPVLFRIGIHGDMPPNDLQVLITHELTHVFEFDLLWGNQGGALTAVSQPPLWTFEGLSEYTTGHWSSWSTLILRDAVLNDRLPEFNEAGDLVQRYPMPREPAYDVGHAVYEFLVEKYGRGAIRDLWVALKSSSLLSRRDPFQRTFRIPARQFGQEFKRWLRARFKDYYTRENPEDYSIPLGPEYPMNPYYFAFSHAISPSGELVATITFNALASDMDIVLLSAKDGRILKNITKGTTTDYQYIRYDIDPSNGPLLAWSPDGDRIVFFARDGRRHSLFIVSPVSGQTLKTIRLDVDQPGGPTFLPDGKAVIFAALRKGIRDIFRLDLTTGALTPLTDDPLYEKAPSLSPDGRSLVYSIRVGEKDRLFLSPLNDMTAKTQLTFGPGNTVCPSFSPDGRTIYYAGDAQGAFNVYSLSLDTGEVRRHTNVRTGNFFPAALPAEPGRILFSSFNKGAFQLFKGEANGPVESTVAFARVSASTPLEKFAPAMDFTIDATKIEPHKGIGRLFVTARPPVEAVVSTDGSIYGGSAIGFSDIMGNHQFSISAYQVREFRSMAVGYLNQAGRLLTAVNLFQYSIYYYPQMYYYDPTLWNYVTYADATAVRRITGAQFAMYYPFSLYLRAAAGLGLFNYQEELTDPYGSGLYTGSSRMGFINGTMATATLALTGETTRFQAYGPAAGSTFRIAVSQSLPLAASWIRNTTVEADIRKYLPIGSDILLALRWQGRLCRGRDPFMFYYGGNNEVRSAYYYSLTATEYWIANAELRFPIIHLAQTILGTIGPVRGAVVFDMTRSRYPGYPAEFYVFDETYTDGPIPYYRVAKALGSFGYGIELFLFGFPLHFEWIKQLQWESLSDPFKITGVGSYKMKFWIGFDF